MAKEQPDKERCGTGDRGKATYKPVILHRRAPNCTIDVDGTVWRYGYE